MEIVMDAETISEAGFDTYLTRELFTTESGGLMVETRYTDASNLVGGIIGSEGILYLGSKQIKLDGRKRQILIGDEILIGYP